MPRSSPVLLLRGALSLGAVSVGAVGCRPTLELRPWAVELPEETVPAADSGTAVGDSGPTAGPDSATDTASSDSATPSDTGPGDSELGPPPPALDAAGVAEALQQSLAGGLPNPMRSRQAYLGMFAGRDASCPGGSQPSLPGRFEGCWSEAGWFYAGYAEYAGSADPDEQDEAFTLLADGRMIDAAGEELVCAGELAYTPEAGTARWTGSLRGTWSYGGADDWMEDPSAGGILTYAAEASAGGWRLELSGSVAGAAHPIVLREVVVASDDCGAATSGELRLRGEGGYWYTLALEACGCGPVTYDDGSALGEACVDLAPAARPLAQWRL